MDREQWQRNSIAWAHCVAAWQKVPMDLIDERIQPQAQNVQACINRVEGSQVGSGLGYIAEDEIQFMLDTLESIGLMIPCRGGFWRDLEYAAEIFVLYGPLWRYREQYRLALNRLKEEEQKQNDNSDI